MDAISDTAWSVLIIDDDVGIRQSLRLCLEVDNARVLGVGTAAAALEVLERSRFDLVLLDLWLGSESGLAMRHHRMPLSRGWRGRHARRLLVRAVAAAPGGAWGLQCPSVDDYVAVTGARDAAIAAEWRESCRRSLEVGAGNRRRGGSRAILDHPPRGERHSLHAGSPALIPGRSRLACPGERAVIGRRSILGPSLSRRTR
jgi:response regulator receiver domain-containing protein